MARLGERAQEVVEGLSGEEGAERFRIDARDFLSARERGGTTGTRIEQQSAALSDAAEIVNRSFPTLEPSGQFINAISPVVIPNRQSLFWRLMPIGMLAVFVLVGAVATIALSAVGGSGLALALFGPHLWLLLVALAVFTWWRQSVVMVPDGCRAVITRFGRLEEVAGAGRKLLFNPWKQVSYIVNTTREYPYNAPIRRGSHGEPGQRQRGPLLAVQDRGPRRVHLHGRRRQGVLRQAGERDQRGHAGPDLRAARRGYLRPGRREHPEVARLPERAVPSGRALHQREHHPRRAVEPGVPDGPRRTRDGAGRQGGVHLRVRAQAAQGAGRGRPEQASWPRCARRFRRSSAEIATYQAQIDTARERETNRANARRAPADGRGREHGERERRAARSPGAGHPGRQQRRGAGDPGVPLPAGRAGAAGGGRRPVAADRADRAATATEAIDFLKISPA